MVSIKALQERVSGLFYAHGLFCASHPVPIISLVIIIALFICFPLVNLPLPANAPLQYTTPIEGYKIPPLLPMPTPKDPLPSDTLKQPRWYFGSPIAYIQQIVVKAAVSPWEPSRLIPSDAFRAPLAQVFDLVEQINNFYYKEGEQPVAVTDVCLHVAETVKAKKIRSLLPEYKCLTLSPANIWNNDKNRFDTDSDIIGTIFRPFGNGLDAPPSIADILFGVPRQEMGVKKLYLRNRQRVISYAVTLVFNKYNPKLISKLRDKLQHSYPISYSSNNTKVHHLSHVHYKSVNHFAEYTPLLVTYLVLFLYLYFSVRKIEMVKSKWGLALSAVVTVVASLLMSVSICLIFGLTPSLNGSEIFPYLVIIIGLENVLVVTKSVVSTPVHLDVKLRVAQGLSKEGWYIFKNLMTELSILFIGFFTFVPAIQEFCLFAVVGLLSDFFLQMFFYATVLSIDMRRMELSDLHKKGVQPAIQKPSQDCVYTLHPPRPTSLPSGMSVGAGHIYPRLPTPPPSPTSDSPTILSDDMFFVDPTRARTPRRVKILNFWARTRVAQRGIMVCVVVWIVLLVYKTGIVEHLTQTNLTDNLEDNNGASLSSAVDKLFSQHDDVHTWPDQDLKINNDMSINGDGYLSSLLYHEDKEVWKRLSHQHWPTLLSYYNISLQGRYLSILPCIHLSSQITPDVATAMRHPEQMRQAAYYHRQEQHVPAREQGPQLVAEHSQAAPNESLTLVRVIKRIARVPRTRLDLAVTVLLGIASLILLLYFVATLYRCMCSRNYAKWRSSWAKRRKPRKSSPYYKQIREAVPKVLEGHPQAVECVVTDGPLVASSCLEGQIRVWDSSSGECIAVIPRKSESYNGTRDLSTWRDPENGIEVDPESTFSSSPPYTSMSPCQPSAPYNIPIPKSAMSRSWSASSPPQTSRQRVTEPPRGHHRSKSIGVSLREHFPDLSETIDTDFSAMYRGGGGDARSAGTLRTSASSLSLESGLPTAAAAGGNHAAVQQPHPAAPGGYDFTRFQKYYTDHEKYLEEKTAHMSMRRRNTERRAEEAREAAYDYDDEVKDRRSWSFGDQPLAFDAEIDSALSLSDTSLAEMAETPAPPVWCLACQDNLVLAGCKSGQLEFWDGLTGQLKYIYHDNSNGITALCVVANRVIVGRLNGTVDFLELETCVSTNKPSAPATSSRLHNRGHVRQPSSSSLTGDLRGWDDIVQCTLLASVRAHQKPINLVQTQGGRVVTASQDHTLKVFRLEDSYSLFTLYGHSASVTTLFIDRISPSCGVSGAEDGTVRAWDLVSGSCVHKLEGHNGAITSLTCTQVYIISAGSDDRLCVWERWKGHLMHKIQMEQGYCNSLGMLTSNLMVTGGQGCLYLWDVSKGEVLRGIRLDDHDNSVFIRQIQVIGSNMVACDYGKLLIVIQFPAVLEKAD